MHVVLNVQEPMKLAQFYADKLGMQIQPGPREHRLSYEGQDSCLVLRQSVSRQRYEAQNNDRYWKIGITLPNLDLAYSQLKNQAVAITQPRQFEDIGYLCHLTDPEGFCIELLQHTFAGEQRTSEGDANSPLGGGAKLGQITLRTTDIHTEIEHYQNQLGMKLLSVQPVRNYGFDLYFLAFTEDQPPNCELTSVENRSWLWQRPYTTLEFQHLLSEDLTVKQPVASEAGYSHLETIAKN